MIELALKLILIAVLIFIFCQDIKDRMVYWFLYPLFGVAGFILHARYIGIVTALISSFISLGIMAVIVLVSYLYAALMMKKAFLNESIGAGDILLFSFLPFTFASITFIVLYVFSLFFSLVLHLVLARNQIDKTVPLAGYISLFFAIVYTISFFTEPKYLFSY